tara:strand:+ start:199 stop:363 length:165 start_codon:yes stop_codon:yes gene_type:complete
MAYGLFDCIRVSQIKNNGYQRRRKIIVNIKFDSVSVLIKNFLQVAIWEVLKVSA